MHTHTQVRLTTLAQRQLKLTLTDLAEFPHTICFAKRHVGSLCNRDNTSAGSAERDQTNKEKENDIKGHRGSNAGEKKHQNERVEHIERNLSRRRG